MSELSRVPVTVIIATRNESANIVNCLQSLAPATRVIVVDSFSQDGTIELAQTHGAEVVQFRYAGGYPKKRQWAIDSLGIETEWVLLVDADELVPASLWREINEAICATDGADAYLCRKQFNFMGKALRFGGFSHSAVVLLRRTAGRFEQLLEDDPTGMDMEVHERIQVSGRIGRFKNSLIHRDHKGLIAYLDRHNRYADWEAALRVRVLSEGHYAHDGIVGRLFGDYQQRRRAMKKLVMLMPAESLIWFFYHYVIRLGFLEGRRGLIACQIRKAYIQNVRARVWELRGSARASNR